MKMEGCGSIEICHEAAFQKQETMPKLVSHAAVVSVIKHFSSNASEEKHCMMTQTTSTQTTPKTSGSRVDNVSSANSSTLPGKTGDFSL